MLKTPGSSRLHVGAPRTTAARVAARLTRPPVPRARLRRAVVLAVTARLLAVLADSLTRRGERTRNVALRLDARAVDLTYPRVRANWRRLPDPAHPVHGVAPTPSIVRLAAASIAVSMLVSGATVIARQGSPSPPVDDAVALGAPGAVHQLGSQIEGHAAPPVGDAPSPSTTLPEPSQRPLLQRRLAVRPTTIPTKPGATPEPARTLAAAGPVGPLDFGRVPVRNGALPIGKGMWIWMPERAEGGNARAIVQRAKQMGLTHLFVRTGSTWMGFYAGPFLDQLLPAAHAAGIRVYGWDFPSLEDWSGDVNRAVAAIIYTTPGGHRIDGFTADIERPAQGTHLTPGNALGYGILLRQAVGYGYPLIACVPKLSGPDTTYPYPQVVAPFDAVAPMVYWLNRDPGDDVRSTIGYLAKFGKPIIPVGQAYDGATDGGPAGSPGRAAIQVFMQAAEDAGATSVSFWDWQHATQEQWDALRDSPAFTIPVRQFRKGQVNALQAHLRTMGFGASYNGVMDVPTIGAIKDYQSAAGLLPTGEVDELTRDRLLTPFTPPIRPIPH